MTGQFLLDGLISIFYGYFVETKPFDFIGFYFFSVLFKQADRTVDFPVSRRGTLTEIHSKQKQRLSNPAESVV
jgi:hypothetical protein